MDNKIAFADGGAIPLSPREPLGDFEIAFKNLEELHMVLTELEDRINPILMSDAPSALKGSPDEDMKRMRSAYGDKMEQLHESIRNIVIRIDVIRNRVDL